MFKLVIISVFCICALVWGMECYHSTWHDPGDWASRGVGTALLSISCVGFINVFVCISKMNPKKEKKDEDRDVDRRVP